MLTPWVFLVSLAWVCGDTNVRLTQSHLSFTGKSGRTVQISCKLSGVSLKNVIMHWYQQKEGEPLKRILYGFGKNYKQDMPNSRLEARDNDRGIFYLVINNVIESDEATYYCACWDHYYYEKVFGAGTKLVVIDKKLDGDFSPKPTIFLPSIAETKLHKAGTYLCLLEKFFPDVIKVYWKEKNGDTILESQEGNTMKINGTYMKFSWLTVPQKSFDKEHRCIVEHENTRESKQEILFPAINKGTVLGAVEKKRKPSSLGSENRTVLGTTDMEGKPDQLGYAKDVLRLQLTNSSVYYTYLLLLLKSSVYLAIVTFSLFRRTADCSAEKSS